MQKETFVVTGGNGYLGAHMCKLLHQAGHNVHIFDNYSTSPQKPTHNYGKFHAIDMTSAEALRLLKEIKPDAVFHFAAKTLVSEGEEKPFFYYQENFISTLKLVEHCIAAKIKNFIFSSTCAVFGLPQTEKLSETHVKNPINTYGYTKYILEEMMKDLAQKKLMNFVIFRYFNASGCSPQGEIGENHEPESHLIPNLCRGFLGVGGGKFKLFGTDFSTRDGTAIRDYIHVDDLVGVHYQGHLFLKSNPGIHDFNLGSEQGFTVKEVITVFEKVTGKKLDYETHARRPGDPPQLVGDSSKAKKLLNFKLRYNLEESVTHAFNYYKKKFSP